MVKIEEEKFKLLLIVFFFGIIFNLFILIFYYQKNINFKIKEVLDTEEEKKVIQREIEKIVAFKRKEMLEKNTIEQIRKILIDLQAPVDFLVFLEKISQKCNVWLEVVSVEEPMKASSEDNFLNFQLKTIGNFENIFCFLAEVEFSSFLIRIEKINFSVKKEGKMLEGIFDIQIYGKKPQ